MTDIYKADTALQTLKAIGIGLDKGTYSSYSKDQLDNLADAVKDAYHTLENLTDQVEGRTFSDILNDKNKDVTTKALESLALLSVSEHDPETIKQARKQLNGLENRALKHKDIGLYGEFASAVETFSAGKITDYDANKLYVQSSSDLIIKLEDLKYGIDIIDEDVTQHEPDLEEVIELDDNDIIEVGDVLYIKPTTVIFSEGKPSVRAYGEHTIQKKDEDLRGTDGADYFLALDHAVENGNLGNKSEAGFVSSDGREEYSMKLDSHPVVNNKGTSDYDVPKLLIKERNQSDINRHDTDRPGNKPTKFISDHLYNSVKLDDASSWKRKQANDKSVRKRKSLLAAAAGIFVGAALGAAALLGYGTLPQYGNRVDTLLNHQTHKIEAVYQNSVESNNNVATPTPKTSKTDVGIQSRKNLQKVSQAHHMPDRTVKSLPKTSYNTYDVKKNDTIVSRWQQYHKDGGEMSWNEFLRAVRIVNPHKKDLNKIWVGEKLKLPTVPHKAAGNEGPASRWRLTRLFR